MQNKKIKKSQSGFTLIEILVVIGLIALLAAVVIIAINPARQFAQGRNSQRVSNVNAILNAIGQRIADNKGVFEGGFSVGGTTYVCGKLPSTKTEIYNTMAATSTEEGGNLGCLVPTYISALPMDPTQTSTGSNTFYMVEKDANGRVTICAPKSKDETAIGTNPEEICVTR